MRFALRSSISGSGVLTSDSCPCRLWVVMNGCRAHENLRSSFGLLDLQDRKQAERTVRHAVLVLRWRVVPRAHVCAYRCYLPPMFQKSLSQACLSPERTGTLAMGSGCIGSFSAVPLLSTAVTAIFFATTALP